MGLSRWAFAFLRRPSARFDCLVVAEFTLKSDRSRSRLCPWQPGQVGGVESRTSASNCCPQSAHWNSYKGTAFSLRNHRIGSRTAFTSLVETEREHCVACGDRPVPLAAPLLRHRSGRHLSSQIRLPQQLTGSGIESLEVPFAAAGE